MALVSPQQVSDGTSIVASNVNNPINTIANDYNGNITNANISASAAVDGSKLATASVPTTTLINDWQTNYVVSGGVIAVSSGLVGTFSNCVVVIDGYKMTLSSVPNKTYTASKDTYVDILRTGTTPSVVYTEVANNAASPALASSSIRVGIVVSSGVGLTINQGQPTAVLPIASSVPYAVTDSLGNLIYNLSPNPTIIGYRELTGAFTTVSASAVQITGLSCPVIVPTNRRVRVSLRTGQLSSTAAGAYAELSIWDGTVGSGTQLDAARGTSPSGGNYSSPMAQRVVQPATSSKTYNAGLATNGGTGATNASSTNPIALTVELA